MTENLKILFVYHNPFEDGRICISIASLSGMLKQHGFDTKLFDTTFWRDRNEENLMENRKIREKLGGYKTVKEYNPQRKIVDLKEKFRDAVTKYKPDLIAATSTSHEFNSLLKFVHPIKMEFKIPFIVGGSHATADPDKAIQKKTVDFVCIGEGEGPLLDLVIRMKEKRDYSDISSLWIKKDSGDIVKNPIRSQNNNLDVLPDPDWDLFDSRHIIRPFEGELKRYGFFETSRGCPHNCSYCLNAKLHKIKTEDGKKFASYRYHSPEEIVRKVKKYKDKYQINHVQFIDENMANMPLDRLKKLTKLYKLEVNIPFFTQSRPDPFVRQPEKAKLMADMGCIMLGIGVETANENLNTRILNRPMKTSTVEGGTKILKDAGILIATYYIIGFPTETKEMIENTIKLHKRIKPDRYSVRFLHPYPGTPIRDYCISKGYFRDDFEERIEFDSYFSEPILNLPSPPHPTKQELIELRDKFSKI